MDQNQTKVNRELSQAFETIPHLKSYRVSDFQISPLPGYTNLNYRLVNSQVDWVLRIPRQQTNGFVNRSQEQFNRTQAANLGLTNNYLWSDDSGLCLTPTLTNSKTLTPVLLQQQSLLQGLAQQIKKLHSSQVIFKGYLDIGETIHRYYDCLEANEKQILASRIKEAEPSMVFFNTQNIQVPTHSDLNENNILLDDDQRLWFIDWEYSAMANPYWDLAIVCHYCQLSGAQMVRFLNWYCDGDASLVESELADFVKLIALLTDCWMAALVD